MRVLFTDEHGHVHIFANDGIAIFSVTGFRRPSVWVLHDGLYCSPTRVTPAPYSHMIGELFVEDIRTGRSEEITFVYVSAYLAVLLWLEGVFTSEYFREARYEPDSVWLIDEHTPFPFCIVPEIPGTDGCLIATARWDRSIID